MREDSIVYFPNHQYWEYLKTGIALNIDGTIRKLDSPNAEGDN